METLTRSIEFLCNNSQEPAVRANIQKDKAATWLQIQHEPANPARSCLNVM